MILENNPVEEAVTFIKPESLPALNNMVAIPASVGAGFGPMNQASPVTEKEIF